MKTLGDCLGKKSYNLSFIKFLAAILVIYSHSYHVTMGNADKEPLILLTSGAISLGGFAVLIFLFSSGLYITKSLMVKKDIKEYIKNRLVRIFPLLIVVILLTVFVMGPIVTELSVGDYFTSKETYGYLRYMVLLPVYSLPGVFTSNPSSLVNGSLWTLILEVICYLGVLIAYKMKLLSKKPMIVAFAGLIIMSIMVWIMKIDFINSYETYIRPWMIFVMGMIFYVFSNKIKLSWEYTVVSIVGVILFGALGYVNIAMVFFMPYILCSLAYSKYQVSDKIARLGNYSYAMYLVAFPIQQMVCKYLPESNFWINTIVSTIFTIILAIILNVYVEEKISNLLLKKH